jgi:hypothetical protein
MAPEKRKERALDRRSGAAACRCRLVPSSDFVVAAQAGVTSSRV